MVGTNAQTLASYDAHLADYIAGTAPVASGAEKIWLDAALSGLPHDAKLLELGSGPGRDAIYIQQQGYKVACTDATPAFVAHLRGLGLQAQHLNILADPLPSSNDLIIANSVLLHFNRAEFRIVLAKMSDALETNGRFAFSLKRGVSEGWSNHKLNAPRYFCYWQPDDLPALMTQAGFSSWSIAVAVTDRTHADWLFILARK